VAIEWPACLATKASERPSHRSSDTNEPRRVVQGALRLAVPLRGGTSLMVALALLGLRSLRTYDFSGAGHGSVFDASVAGSDRVWDALPEAVFADLMAESPKPPVEGRGARSPERDGDPDPPREQSVQLAERAKCSSRARGRSPRA
jgi:hypothetical protein